MGDIFTNSKIEEHVNKLFKKRYAVLDNNGQRGAVATMAQRLRELRKRGRLIVAYDPTLKRTVFVLSDDVKVDKCQRYHFGGGLIRYVLTGRD